MASARHCDIQLNPQNKYRNARKRELQKMCKPDMHCALVPQLTYTKRASGMTRSVSMHYMSISRMLYFVYSIKSQGLSRTKINFKYFQGLEIRLTYIHILLDHSLNRAFQGQWKQMTKQIMQMNITWLRIPTSRRQTSWLFTNVAEGLNWGLPRNNSS